VGGLNTDGEATRGRKHVPEGKEAPEVEAKSCEEEGRSRENDDRPRARRKSEGYWVPEHGGEDYERRRHDDENGSAKEDSCCRLLPRGSVAKGQEGGGQGNGESGNTGDRTDPSEEKLDLCKSHQRPFKGTRSRRRLTAWG